MGGGDVELLIEIPASAANTHYLFFQPFDWTPGGLNINNDFLVYQAAIEQSRVARAGLDRSTGNRSSCDWPPAPKALILFRETLELHFSCDVTERWPIADGDDLLEHVARPVHISVVQVPVRHSVALGRDL